jgi:hypothetical protein
LANLPEGKSMTQIRYTPVVIAAGGTWKSDQIHGLGAFIPTVTGTITITDGNGNVVLNACPVTAGTRLELTMYTQGNTAVVALTSAAGTLLYY